MELKFATQFLLAALAMSGTTAEEQSHRQLPGNGNGNGNGNTATTTAAACPAEWPHAIGAYCCDDASNPTVCQVGGNPKCDALKTDWPNAGILGGSGDNGFFKIDGDIPSGFYSDATCTVGNGVEACTGSLTGSPTIEIVRTATGELSQDLTPADGIACVIMKGGNSGAVVYFGDAMNLNPIKTPLNGPNNRAGLSHIEWCQSTTPPSAAATTTTTSTVAAPTTTTTTTTSTTAAATTTTSTAAAGGNGNGNGNGGNGNGNGGATTSTAAAATSTAAAATSTAAAGGNGNGNGNGGGGGGNGGGGNTGFADDTCNEEEELGDRNLLPTGNIRCCKGFYEPDDSLFAACDTSSCVNNFGAQNRNCFNYGSSQHPNDGTEPDNSPAGHGNGGSALCPYLKSDKAICDVEAFNRHNGVNCRVDQSPSAGGNNGNHCLGYVKCQTSGVIVPQQGHSDGLAPWLDGQTFDDDNTENPTDPSHACSSTDYPAGTICFYNGHSENFKVCDFDAPAPASTTSTEPQIEQNAATGVGAFGDPHVRTWSGEHFEYHGTCDLVLVQNPAFDNNKGLDINIRNKRVGRWSYIDTAVIRIGSDTLEVMGQKINRYWVNGNKGKIEIPNGEMEQKIAGHSIKYDQLSKGRRRFVIDLGNGEEIIIKTFKYFVRVHVKTVPGGMFEGSVGLMGTYPDGKKVGRDGVTEITDYNEFGQEWQVAASEPMLFRRAEGRQAPEQCELPLTSTSRRLAESSITLEDAEIACARVNEEDRDACIFDVLATEDKDMAGAY